MLRFPVDVAFKLILIVSNPASRYPPVLRIDIVDLKVEKDVYLNFKIFIIYEA